MQNSFLCGEKVYLRPLEKEDGPALVPWLNDPAVTRTLQISQPMSLLAEIAYLEKISQSKDDVTLGIVSRQSDKLIGAAGLHQIDWRARHASFGILIGILEEWGKGYGTEATHLMMHHAFGTMNLNRVWLHVVSTHEAGIRAYERVGFRREGVLRQQFYREGRYQDLLVMAILRDEWAAPEAATARAKP